MKALSKFYDDISKILLETRQKVYVSVNSEMVMAYWRIGKRIIEEEQSGEKRAEYGTNLIEQLSEKLSNEFGKGFSIANIKNFRQFYLTFSENEIRYALRSELTWTHYRSIMRVENSEARKYYINRNNRSYRWLCCLCLWSHFEGPRAPPFTNQCPFRR